MKLCCTSTEPHHSNPAPTHIWRGNLVQEHYLMHAKRLQGYYESLLATFKANAPDLLPMLESPKPPQYGYQILPKLIADTPLPDERLRLQSAWYSWPWTDELIASELKEIVRAAAELNGTRALNATSRRRLYETLARNYTQFRQRQKNIDAHIQYNRLWQAAIASNRSGYDLQTVLHNAVLERQAILEALKAPDNAAVNKALAGFSQIHASQSQTQLKSRLMEREKLLARNIHDAIHYINTPTFIRLEDRSPHLSILHVPFYTDIADHDFAQSVKRDNRKNLVPP